MTQQQENQHQEAEMMDIARDAERVDKLLRVFDPKSHEEFQRVMSRIKDFKKRWNLPSEPS